MSKTDSFTIKNKNGMEVTAIELGATLTSIRVPDRRGRFQNIILGYPTPQDYEQDSYYMGCVVGRYAGRIAGAKFAIEGHEYPLAKNEVGTNHLHGGIRGWNKKLWELGARTEKFLEFALVSPDGEEGYPGEVAASVRYTLDDENRLNIRYRATSSKPTPINLTQHCYFNLSGDPNRTIENNLLRIHSSAYLPCDSAHIPSGEICRTLFEEKPLGNLSFDETWILENHSTTPQLAATLDDRASGRRLDVYTTEPSVHVYTGDYLGIPFKARAGICLETQHYPDSPNQPHFPSTVLKPGEVFESHTIWEFRTT